MDRSASRTRNHPTKVRAGLRALVSALAGVIVLLSGVAAVVTPSAPAAAATAPAQGWTTVEAPLPADSGTGSTNPDVYTASSVCPAANGCITVGWYKDTSDKAWGLIETQSGTTWTDTEAPQPSNAGSGADQGLWIGSQDCGIYQPCHAVSCPTATFCVGVGEYLDTAGYSLPVVETLSGGSWSAAEGALPSDTGTDGGPVFPAAFLFSVSCVSTTSCVAVGQYRNTSGDYVPLIDTLSGTTWTALPSPLPSDAIAQTSSFGTFLNSVSCTSASFCVASGFYQDTSSGYKGLLVTLSNGSWTAQTASQPSDSGNDGDGHQGTFLTGLSCASAAACTSVGYYEDTSGDGHGLIDSFNGSAWTAAAAPLPSNAASSGFDQLDSVVCPSPTSCTSVGLYNDTNGKSWGWIVTLAGGTWSATQAPQPANASPEADQFAILYDLSCPTPNFCMAAGSYTAAYNGGSTNLDTGYVETKVAGTWSTIEAPVPSNVSTTGTLYSVARTAACYSPVACAVGGFYTDPGNTQGFLDTYTGVQGYWLGASDGGVFNYGNAQFEGSTGSLHLNKPVVGIASTPDGGGYWLVASDGGVFTEGDALFHGSAGSLVLNKPVVGMAATPDGKGYWLVASDGGIFTYGDAGFFGSRGGQPLNKPIVGMAATADGKGYWLVASDGGIFNYGDAAFAGSAGSLVLNKPVVGMAATPDGGGYWLVATDGGIFNYGDALFYGSSGSLVLNKPVVGMAASPSGKGYWLVASDGGIFNYGDAPFYGSAGSLVLNKPVVGMAS